MFFTKSGNGPSEPLRLNQGAYVAYQVPTEDSEKEKSAWINIANQYIKIAL
jgi:hypothetical protein